MLDWASLQPHLWCLPAYGPYPELGGGERKRFSDSRTHIHGGGSKMNQEMTKRETGRQDQSPGEERQQGQCPDDARPSCCWSGLVSAHFPFHPLTKLPGQGWANENQLWSRQPLGSIDFRSHSHCRKRGVFCHQTLLLCTESLRSEGPQTQGLSVGFVP